MSEDEIRAWEDLSFDIVKETWNLYYLENGVRIRGRSILTKLMRRRKDQDYEYSADFQNIFSVSAPSHLKGPPGPSLTSTEIQNASKIGKPVKIIDSREDWNI